MFYSGLYVNSEDKLASLVIIEKDLKTARKLYRVCHIKKLVFTEKSDSLIDTMRTISKNDTFIRKKKVFSQDGKPPKNTWTPPVFLMAEKVNTGEEVKKIRKEHFSAEALIFEENKKWHKQEVLPLRCGSNYFVNPEDIIKTLKKACKGDRLLFNDNVRLASELKEDLQLFSTNEQASSDLISALSIAVWFCERVRQIKRY